MRYIVSGALTILCSRRPCASLPVHLYARICHYECFHDIIWARISPLVYFGLLICAHSSVKVWLQLGRCVGHTTKTSTLLILKCHFQFIFPLIQMLLVYHCPGSLIVVVTLGYLHFYYIPTTGKFQFLVLETCKKKFLAKFIFIIRQN